MTSEEIAALTSQYEAEKGAVETTPILVGRDVFSGAFNPVFGEDQAQVERANRDGVEIIVAKRQPVKRTSPMRDKALAYLTANPTASATEVSSATGICVSYLHKLSRNKQLNGIKLAWNTNRESDIMSRVIAFIKANPDARVYDIRSATKASEHTIMKARIRCGWVDPRKALTARHAIEELLLAGDKRDSDTLARQFGCTRSYVNKIRRDLE